MGWYKEFFGVPVARSNFKAYSAVMGVGGGKGAALGVEKSRRNA